MTTSPTVQQTIDEFRTTLSDYIEATYHIGHPTMVAQRKRLLAENGTIHQVPYLESTPRYTTGGRYADMPGIPEAARETYLNLSAPVSGQPILFDPPYSHQAEAIRQTLGNGKNLMVMTGTGSGKTESFLLPILGKLAMEAREKPSSFKSHNALRAIILYPMNALVNDQLGRLRLMFGDPRTVAMFREWAGRPARFARYTSRTPYAGVRSSSKDSDRLGSIGDFFVEIERAAAQDDDDVVEASEGAKALRLFDELKARGKWPAKESVAKWYGNDGERWKGKNGQYKRAVVRENDAELMTRHEVQASPPDLLITNYSMLEYMMLRPIERPIFDETREWLKSCPDEKILIVMDEAHLYRGAQGAEVGLLLRRLRARLGIGPERMQVICSTASFKDTANADKFGAELTGVARESFVPVTGKLAYRQPEGVGSAADVAALASIDLDEFYDPDVDRQMSSVSAFLKHRGVAGEASVERALYRALAEFPAFNLLVNRTMEAALPLRELAPLLFGSRDDVGERAISALLAIGSRARLEADKPGLLPCRIHSFLRGLPGLWACMDPDCGELSENERGGPAGKLYSQPRERCGCGAVVLEYFTCRDCGTSYGRAYAPDVRQPRQTWHLPGLRIEGRAEPLNALDLLLEHPSPGRGAREVTFDLINATINPDLPSSRSRTVFLPDRSDDLVAEDADDGGDADEPGIFKPCGCCGGRGGYNTSSVQDHQTKGDQPFQAILTTQVRIQPPNPNQRTTAFAPLRGRKVLIFSDSRQVAARLAPALQTFSLRDTVRALVPVGLRMLAEPDAFGPAVSLNDAYVGVIAAAHRLGVRVTPELGHGESMPTVAALATEEPLDAQDLRTLGQQGCPANLLEAVTRTIRDRHLGLEPLAVASIREVPSLTAKLAKLPNIPGLAESPDEKERVVRAWLRIWVRSAGVWLQGMPSGWWLREVTAHQSGNFDAMKHVLVAKGAKASFQKHWLPHLLKLFTEKSGEGFRLVGRHLTLDLGEGWRRCHQCRSVHRAIPNVAKCIDCASADVSTFDPENDPVFEARKGFYRRPVMAALSDEPSVISLIAAEHTAQLNAAQSAEAFSRAENHELRFQDIDLAWRNLDDSEPAIDVLSSTTTMEVGIDIGALSGVALRNMPPGRANYQQRAGRAGRRGNAVATVVAFGSADSHDDHYFVEPDAMIRGPVTDPRLTLENIEIARRHVRAFLLQRYSEDRIVDADPETNSNLFSVLGRIADFRTDGILNRADLETWLDDEAQDLRLSLLGWLPAELSEDDKAALVDTMKMDLLAAIDEAVGAQEADAVVPVLGVANAEAGDAAGETEEIEEERPGSVDDERGDPNADKLLDRLLYKGVLPRYAFPTDVANFYVFDEEGSSSFRPKMKFSPSQGMNVALSQYAPNKQIWINNRQYVSKAIYSPFKEDRFAAWGRRRLYFECENCGHAATEDFVRENRNTRRDCIACHRPGSFGPGRTWLRPPGFAHPIGVPALSKPDDQGETARATRAKLVMPTPGATDAWNSLNDRVRAFPTRRHLLVSNTGPGDEGYRYCVTCGRIESDKEPEADLGQPHPVPYPETEERECEGGKMARRLVLGTDFIADICLFSLKLAQPFLLLPGAEETEAALRTLCEAVAKAACELLDIEPGEILAEHRAALTNGGAAGREVEIFIYDTLAGGAGFSPQLANRLEDLFQRTLDILRSCPEDCDGSCYRCLRSFKNKFEHHLLDRQLAEQLLLHVLEGGVPAFSSSRAKISLDVLHLDLERQWNGSYEFVRDATIDLDGHEVVVPILAVHRETGATKWISLASPITPRAPFDPASQLASNRGWQVISISDLLIRRNLPSATLEVHQALIK